MRLKFTKIIKMYVLLLCFVSCGSNNNSDVLKSSSDKREYAHIVLANGLKVVLVSDANLDKSAASLNVAVGSYHDFPNRDGLAHFCEHMLFLGTEKYPNAGEFIEYLSDRSGHFNATTALQNTQYFYSINAAEFADSLDRFSQFFIAPLFTDSLVDRERHAVNNEYYLYLKNDIMRFIYVLKSLANPLHPFARFNCGNLQTLKDGNTFVRDDLLEFYKQHYVANNMVLSLVGPQSISALQDLASKYFADVPANKSYKKTQEHNSLDVFDKSKLGVRAEIQTLSHMQKLVFTFVVPNQKKVYDKKSIDVISQLLVDTSAGGLYYSLRERQWIDDLSISVDEVDDKKMLYHIDMNITEYGLSKLNDITKTALDYFAFLAKQPEHLYQQFFQQLKVASIQQFDAIKSQDALSLASQLSQNAQDYPIKDLLSWCYFNNKSQLDYSHLIKLLSYFNKNNLLQSFLHPAVQGNEHEPLYDVNYRLDKLAVDVDSNNSSFAYPQSNKFLLKNIDKKLFKKNKFVNKPVMLVDNVWLQSYFKLSESIAITKMLLPWDKAITSPKQVVLAQLWNKVLEDNLFAIESKLQQAGYNVSISAVQQGLEISIYGFGQGHATVAAEVLRLIQQLQVEKSKFEIIKAKLYRKTNAELYTEVFRQGNNRLTQLLYNHAWPAIDRMQLIQSINKDDLLRFAQEQLAQAQLITYSVGGIDKKQVTEFYQNINPVMSIKNQQYIAEDNYLNIPPLGRHIYAFEPNSDNSLSLHGYFTQENSILSVAKVKLLAQLMQSPFFETMRTQQQLGYVVYLRMQQHGLHAWLVACIESATVRAEELNSRMDAFFNEYLVNLHDMPAPQFQTIKDLLVAELLESPADLGDLITQNWQEIINGYNNFAQRMQIAEAINTLEMNDVVSFFKQLILDKEHRRNLIVQTDPLELSEVQSSHNLIRDVAKFKES